MVTGHVVELDPVLVEIIEHCQTHLISFPVIGLRPTKPPSVGPVNRKCPTWRPHHIPWPHSAACPEKSLLLFFHQTQELSLLGGVVDTDRSAKFHRSVCCGGSWPSTSYCSAYRTSPPQPVCTFCNPASSSEGTPHLQTCDWESFLLQSNPQGRSLAQTQSPLGR